MNRITLKLPLVEFLLIAILLIRKEEQLLTFGWAHNKKSVSQIDGLFQEPLFLSAHQTLWSVSPCEHTTRYHGNT